jgi:ribosomal subunit interface protein
MHFPLQITLRGMAHSDAVETEIRERAAKLEQFHPDIVSCRVGVEVVARHGPQAKAFTAHVDVRVPGREIAASHSHDADIYAAVRAAFDAAHRRLDAHAGRKDAGGAPPPE